MSVISTADFPIGNYRYIPGVFQYSAGVAANSGYEIFRARLKRAVPLADGFRLIEEHLKTVARPLTSLCACELRSPAPFTEEGFKAFNNLYVGTLEDWGVFKGGVNPVARSNVCPAIDPPATPSLYAFSYTVPSKFTRFGTFQIAGSAEAPEGKQNYQSHIVRRGEHSVDALLDKARFVLREMERRLGLLGLSWQDATATQLYTVYDPYPVVTQEITKRGAMSSGLTWHFCRPPVVDLDYEMDVRAVRSEIVV